MSDPLDRLLRLTSRHTRAVAEVLTNAFFDDPLYEWIFPDPHDRARILPLFFRLRTRLGLKYGAAYGNSAKIEGVAIWYPSETAAITPLKVLLAGGLPFSLMAGKDALSKLNGLSRFADELHHRIAPFPHWYLSPLAVDPMYQGQGIARTLLTAMLNRLDADGLPCFLETQSDQNVALYEKFGFTVAEARQISGTGMQHLAMLRHPR